MSDFKKLRVQDLGFRNRGIKTLNLIKPETKTIIEPFLKKKKSN